MLRSSEERAALMIFLRSLEGAEKCALRHLRREELTLGEYFILPVGTVGCSCQDAVCVHTRSINIENIQINRKNIMADQS